jgi:glycosyltransferase involved in cell wall biosynthesis
MLGCGFADKRFMRVVLVNNYDLASIYEQWRRSPSPAHHLWGFDQLERAGVEVRFLPFQGDARLKRWGEKLKLLGDLDQCWRLFRTQGEYDVIFSAHHFTTLGAALLRRLGLLRKPIVAVCYQSFRKGLMGKILTRLLVAGHDRLLVIGEATLEHVRDVHGVSDRRLKPFFWAYDLPYYDPSWPGDGDTGPRYLLAAGKTYRDYPTLIGAVSQTEAKLRILSMGQFAGSDQLPACVEVGPSGLDWKQVLEQYRYAFAIAIPLKLDAKKPHNAIGLTSLLEAMAMGRPILMTRNEFVGIDIEAEGIGYWIEPGDTEGWRRGIEALYRDMGLARAMGERARRLAESKYNYPRFGQELLAHLREVVAQRT